MNWTTTENPALRLAGYVTQVRVIGTTAVKLDVPAVVVAAMRCDED